MNDNNYINKRIECLSKITDDKASIVSNSNFMVCRIHPKSLIHRAHENSQFFKRYEDYSVIEYKKANVYFKENITDLHKKTINSSKQNVFKAIFEQYDNNNTLKLLFHSYLPMIDVYGINFSNMNFDEKYDIIMGLYKILDLILYKTEKSERGIKSTYYDANHLLYASNYDKFITNDNRLYHRAIEIYSFLNIKTKVLLFHEYLKQIT
jgi:hypothetical protein